ncbi:MAG: cysteine desulfurase family protein [Patescibacteria group bacterium]|jgi:cysteine desulfurase
MQFFKKKAKEPNIYLDYAAATPVAPEVAMVMAPYYDEYYGNPSSLHRLGKQSRVVIDAAARAVAEILGAHSDEIIFTPSGTASDNLAVLGTVRASHQPVPHVVTSTIEHDAVREPLRALVQDKDARVTSVPVDREGRIDPAAIVAAIVPETVLVSVMYANNEIGVIEPIVEIGKLMKRVNRERTTQGLHPVYFHTDACQAAAFLPLAVEKLGVDLLTLNAAKLYGPKGVGALYVRRGITLAPLIYGGGQQHGLVAGTENVPAIVGLAAALTLARRDHEAKILCLTSLRDYFTNGILAVIPGSTVNGHATLRLPNNVNVCLPGVDAEGLIVYLSEQGIYAGTGAACAGAKGEPSHVLEAIGLDKASIAGSVRFTFGESTTKEDIDLVLKALPEIIKFVRI